MGKTIYRILYDILHRLPKVTLLIGQNSANDSSKLQLATKPVSIYIYQDRNFKIPFQQQRLIVQRLALAKVACWCSSAQFRHRVVPSRRQWGPRRRKHQGKEATEEVSCVYMDRIAPQDWVVGNNLKHLEASCTCLDHGECSYQCSPSLKPSLICSD